MADNNTEPDAMVYRVEENDGSWSGYGSSLNEAKNMARSADEFAPDDAPHQVRKVPGSEAQEDGRGLYEVIWTSDHE